MVGALVLESNSDLFYTLYSCFLLELVKERNKWRVKKGRYTNVF